MRQKLFEVIRSWGLMIIILTVTMALLWPLLMILWSALLKLITGNDAMLHSLNNFPAIIETMRKGLLMGFLLGFGLGSFNLLLLFRRESDSN